MLCAADIVFVSDSDFCLSLLSVFSFVAVVPSVSILLVRCGRGGVVDSWCFLCSVYGEQSTVFLLLLGTVDSCLVLSYFWWKDLQVVHDTFEGLCCLDSVVLQLLYVLVAFHCVLTGLGELVCDCRLPGAVYRLFLLICHNIFLGEVHGCFDLLGFSFHLFDVLCLLVKSLLKHIYHCGWFRWWFGGWWNILSEFRAI